MTKESVYAGQESGNNRSGEISRDGKIGFAVSQKMINKFLNYDRIEKIEVIRPRYTKEELAKKLNISTEELEELMGEYVYKNMAVKISWSLAGLYCSTKWIT